ncbi:MAG: LemA family protein [Bacteroidota bacterium]|nr:LemA family protein [Bacteroidota bacterium]
MRQTIIIIGVILVLALLTVVPMYNSYNKMVVYDEQVKASWSQVENVYQRRLDLIPNLVNTVKGAANFEKETLTQVMEARAKATQVTIDPSKMTKENFEQYQEAQGKVSSSLSRLLVSVENYPQLRATESFKELQSQLEGTENRIAVERRKFSELVMEYNAYIRKFPKNIYASWFNFKEKPYFTAEKEAAKAPTVKF